MRRCHPDHADRRIRQPTKRSRGKNSYFLFEKCIKGKLKKRNEKTKLFISDIEAVFFEYNIAIFSLFTSSNDSLHKISSILNRELRNPNCLFFDMTNARIHSFDNSLDNVEELKLEYLREKKNNLVDFNCYIFDLVNSKKCIKISELDSGRSKYAKYITAIHLDVDQDLENELLFSYPKLQHETDVALNILQVCSSHLSISNDFISINRKFEQDINYIRSNIKNYGIRLWSLWSGIASLNSLACISINDGGRSIVHQNKNEIYLIYLIDFYIKLRLQH